MVCHIISAVRVPCVIVYNASVSLLYPDSIAVIGASADEQKVGHIILRNLLMQGYRGGVYPVNPKGGTILEKKVFPSITDIGAPVDLAIIATPAETVEELAEECGKAGVESLIVISAGFGETGKEGSVREEKLARIARKYGMHLVGPNCLGIMRPSIHMNASFGCTMPQAGTVALVSQSGALGDAFLDRAESVGLKLSLFMSMGNKAAMDECDFLQLCAEDPETKVIGLYVENIRNGRRFLELARHIGSVKPIVLLKAGTTPQGTRAVSSHTGALAGSDTAVQAICAQADLHRATSTEEFLDILRTHASQPTLLSPRIAIITNAGGPGVLAADAAEREELVLAALTPKHAKDLGKALPAAASVRNPIDILGDALADRYESALTAVERDPNIDGAAVLLTPQSMTPAKEIAEMIARIQAGHPLLPIVTSFMGGERVRDAISVLHANGIPNFTSPEAALHLLASLRHREQHENGAEIATDAKRAAKAATILKEVGDGLLDEERTEQLFALYKIALPHGHVAATADDAVRIAEEIGYPVTAKVSSKDILHKMDMGGVIVHLTDEKQVRKAFTDIKANAKKNAPKARIAGVLIQQSLPPGNEFIVGALKDPSAGHLVMAGLGGIYTELFRDTSFRVAPVSADEAYPMLTALKSWKLLLGMRGKAKLDIDALAELISTVSLLVTECPQIREIDLNPVLVQEKGLVILDAKVVVE